MYDNVCGFLIIIIYYSCHISQVRSPISPGTVLPISFFLFAKIFLKLVAILCYYHKLLLLNIKSKPRTRDVPSFLFNL